MVTENAKVFIDTNILLYAYSSSEIAKKEKVLLLLENEMISLSTQVINEFIWVMSRKFNVGMDSLSAELLKGTKGRKEISRKAKEAVERYGYSQKEVAD
jgi:predicted nucleic acid-binding protein